MSARKREDRRDRLGRGEGDERAGERGVLKGRKEDSSDGPRSVSKRCKDESSDGERTDGAGAGVVPYTDAGAESGAQASA